MPDSTALSTTNIHKSIINISLNEKTKGTINEQYTFGRNTVPQYSRSWLKNKLPSNLRNGYTLQIRPQRCTHTIKCSKMDGLETENAFFPEDISLSKGYQKSCFFSLLSVCLPLNVWEASSLKKHRDFPILRILSWKCSPQVKQL